MTDFTLASDYARFHVCYFMFKKKRLDFDINITD